MPDLMNFAVTRQEPANVNVPTHQVSGQVIDSTTSEVLADFTGNNAQNWPGVLSTLTVDQQNQIAGQLAPQILLWKAGF
jgi:hypothetical protein